MNMKKLVALFAALVLLLAGTVQAEAPAQSAVPDIRISGAATRGITFATHDVYYDGYLMLVSVTMKPNDDSLFVDECALGWTPDLVDANESKGLTPIGAYCELTVADADGKEISILMTGGGERRGSAVTKTFALHFEPDQPRQELVATLSCAVMEASGASVGPQTQTFAMNLPTDQPAELKEIPLAKLPEELKYLRRVVVAQSPTVASVFLYADPTAHTDAPVSFAADEREIGDAGSITDTCVFGAFRTGALTSIRLRDQLTGHIYELSVADGTVKPV